MHKHKWTKHVTFLAKAVVVATTAVLYATTTASAVDLTDEQMENLVRRSYQYVAMYNVNNKCADDQVQGWNKYQADTQLKDHTLTVIARPNNDTLYIIAMLDVRKEPVILEIPAFDSEYISLLVSGYDHYVNIPLSTRQGDFKKPERILFYTSRTEGYDGEPVGGIDKVFECTGDFLQATVRVMPHAAAPDRYERIVKQMDAYKLMTLSEYRGGKATPIDDVKFPPVGETDADIFENNLLEVMQFVCNHTTFDPKDELDQEILAALKPLGVVPGQAFDPAKVANIDGPKIRMFVERMVPMELAKANDPEFLNRNLQGLFRPKGEMTLERLLFQSIIGPIGLPAREALYPAISTDGKTMNAITDYVLRMSADELPPATAFWSVTLYDTKNGFFIPNDRKKYSVGKNGGMKLNRDGGIVIYIAAEQPEGVPEENWLPLNRGDYGIDVIMRLYVPDLDKIKAWTPPKAEKLRD